MIDQLDVIPKEAVEQDQKRQAVMVYLSKRIMNSMKRKTGWKTSLQKIESKFTRISNRSRQSIKEQGNFAAFEVLELSNKV